MAALLDPTNSCVKPALASQLVDDQDAVRSR
jgi:hypothetical protein